MTEKVKTTVFISEGPDWVEIDSDNNEISRVKKPLFENGHPIKTMVIYAGTLLKEISGHPSSTPVGVMAVVGGKIHILKDGQQIHIDAKMGIDFEFVRPTTIIEDAPDSYRDEEDHDREKISEIIRSLENNSSLSGKNAVVGVDILAEIIAAEQIDIKPENAKVELFHGNGTHSNNGCVVVYDDSNVLKLKKDDILKLVKSRQLSGFIVKPEQIISLLYLSLQAKGLLMSPKASMESRYAVAGELFNVLEEIGMI